MGGGGLKVGRGTLRCSRANSKRTILSKRIWVSTLEVSACVRGGGPYEAELEG